MDRPSESIAAHPVAGSTERVTLSSPVKSRLVASPDLVSRYSTVSESVELEGRSTPARAASSSGGDSRLWLSVSSAPVGVGSASAIGAKP
eukprot:scaffold92027_cov26-Tisochrysis_lutea.AAC.4